MLEDYGYRIPGEELFLDHVHPTVEGHRLLALTLLDQLMKMNIVEPMQNWNRSSAVAAATSRIESRIDPNLQAMALINLSKVLYWAGKFEDAQRSAIQALKIKKIDAKHAVLAINQLIHEAKRVKDKAKIDKLIEAALKLDPWSPMMHYQLALRLPEEKKSHEGASHILISRAFWDTNQTNSLLGLHLYQREKHELAYPFLKKALEQKPGDKVTRIAFEFLQNELGPRVTSLRMPDIVVQRPEGGFPEKVFIQSTTADGKAVPDGIYTEWYSNGRLKGYAEFLQGALHGHVLEWDQKGQVVSRRLYDQGEVIDN